MAEMPADAVRTRPRSHQDLDAPTVEKERSIAERISSLEAEERRALEAGAKADSYDERIQLAKVVSLIRTELRTLRASAESKAQEAAVDQSDIEGAPTTAVESQESVREFGEAENESANSSPAIEVPVQITRIKVSEAKTNVTAITGIADEALQTALATEAIIEMNRQKLLPISEHCHRISESLLEAGANIRELDARAHYLIGLANDLQSRAKSLRTSENPTAAIDRQISESRDIREKKALVAIRRELAEQHAEEETRRHEQAMEFERENEKSATNRREFAYRGAMSLAGLAVGTALALFGMQTVGLFAIGAALYNLAPRWVMNPKQPK